MNSPRVVAILGMHRSGTSWLAGSLQELGLDLGEVSTKDLHNKKGNRESPVVMAIHDGLLKDSGGSWKTPPKTITWTPARRAELAAHVRDMNARFPDGWGFKCPRALFALDEWRKHVPSLVRVGIYRHPLAVHRSFKARGERFDEKRSLSLWNAYNERLIAEHERDPFPLFRFDVSDEQRAADLRRVARFLALPSADAPSSFFDAVLVSAGDATVEPIPEACRDVWAKLESRAAVA